MKAPRFAAVTIALDTERYRQNVRPEVKEHHAAYLLNRLLSGQEVARSEFEHLGMRVSVREATGAEIFVRGCGPVATPAVPTTLALWGSASPSVLGFPLDYCSSLLRVLGCRI